jgi:hypothetical protein
MKTLAAFLAVALASSSALANDGTDIPDEPEPQTVVVTERGSPLWRAAFVTSSVAFIGLAGAHFYYWSSWHGDVDNIRASKSGSGVITQDDCAHPERVDDKNGVFTSLCRKRDRSLLFGTAAMLTVPLAVVTGYFAFFHVTRREKTIAIVPTVTPQVAGATLDIRW